MFDPSSVPFTALALAAALTITAAASDMRSLRIPNRLCLLIAGLYPAYNLTIPVAAPWLSTITVASIILIVGFALFVSGFFGGGDVKLLAALAIWAGPQGIFDLLSITAVTGGAMALVALSPLKFVTAMASEKMGNLTLRDGLLAGRLPYGIAIAAGGLVVLATMAQT